MNIIHQLPQDIIAKIAAGEVIERPAYAVKELIENAIDAHADYITIQIEESGLKKISITDNGNGMNKEDIQICIHPHTTSKILHIEDLMSIASLGFRGEALSSIAAISNILIRSRTNNDINGTEIVIKNGAVEKIAPIGIPIGTNIIVEQLFHTVPVRKKFLKSQATEFRHIGEIVMQYALAFPSIRFFLQHNKKTMLDLPKNQDRSDRIKMLLGNDLWNNLIPITFTSSYLGIQGFLSKPQRTTKNQNKQFIFVNNRRVQDKLIATAIKEAYGNLLEAHASPIFILFLTLPFEFVDVNVHPKKEQVHFANTSMLFETIKKAVTETLEKKNITFHAIRWKHDPLYDAPTKMLYSAKKGVTNSFAGNILKDSISSWNTAINSIAKDAPIEQLHHLYIITQTLNGFLLIDQHAAHERILFEKLSSEFKKQKKLSITYPLNKTIPIELSFSDAQIVHEHLSFFQNFGFTMEHLRKNVFLLMTVPEFLKDHNAEKLIHELIDSLAQEKNPKAIDQQSNKMLAYIACRSAIKAGDTLTKKQMKALLQTLEKTPNNTTCPHGRPTKIGISLAEIHRLFKRK